jgi:ankyrin repeat protein
LKRHLRRDPALISRRFGLREIYPSALGCVDNGRGGMCGTPLDGATLLHLAIEFDEQEIFDLLLAEGADVNARALVDADGFGGHTPLFNAIVKMGQRSDALIVRALLDRGALPGIRATMRKYLDWCETPRWHEARNVTAAEWGRGFPERDWVNEQALEVLEGAA